MAELAAKHPLDKSLSQVNQRLKAAQLGLQIERRGDRLNLRGTLPPRPGSPKLRPYQQRVPLKLPATKAGLKQCEQTAKIIAAQLLQNIFDWRDYLGPVAGLRMAGADLSAQIDAFERHFFETRRSDSSAASIQTTWKKAYVPYLRKLHATAERHNSLSLPEAIYATVQSTKANSRSRQICCTALAALAEFLNLDLPTDLKSFWGNYGNSQTQLRNLPSDDQIVEIYDSLKNPRWRYVYGMMATYGLRNHEVFFCDAPRERLRQRADSLEPTSHAEIIVHETTKTGRHEVWPFYPEWVERFDLANGELPQINTDLDTTTLQRVGQQVTTQFRRYKIPFSPYDLRHAWAVRTILIGLPDAVAARMMGHSVQVHNRTYHRWMTHRDQQAAVQAALAKNKISAPM
ncbi:site-specific integrase [Leptothoe spongobia]|uniref:Site-specific integrase n=1 Tax=Leptothoe spongobia TAU-MAC 1115 TaxID=1967444 RepID=A0A947DAY4_9CYAN|nr:site-specific integrase [Leptothoe spongobia]MBT9313952.1 site-specific integrase [Leptothoe spongobia TAU-MAC 1115]